MAKSLMMNYHQKLKEILDSFPIPTELSTVRERLIFIAVDPLSVKQFFAIIEEEFKIALGNTDMGLSFFSNLDQISERINHLEHYG